MLRYIYVGDPLRLFKSAAFVNIQLKQMLSLFLPFALIACGPQSGVTITKNDLPPVVTGSCEGSGPSSTKINLFNENPRTSSGNLLLPFSSTLTTSMTSQVTLSGLDGSCLMQNDRFKILADDFYSTSIATITSSSTLYSPTQPQFQQLASFYYATSLRNLMASLNADLAALGKVDINAHCNVSDNAYYSPTYKEVCLGYTDIGGGKKIWASDDADVVIHESGHAVNHTLASTSILNSTGEAGAIDESIADYWALTVMNDAQLSEWFLGAMGSAYIRDATASHLYPDSMVYEIHDDSRVLTELLWDLRGAGNLGKSTTDALVKRALQLLPGTTRFKDFYQAFYTASGPSFLNLSAPQRALIVSKFTAKGLHRADSTSGLQISTNGAHKPLYIIDDHTISAQVGGNCNGVLDVGETALVLLNLENTGSNKMGMGVATLGAAPSGTSIPSGGQIGEFFRLNNSADFISSLPAGTSNKQDAVIMAAFLIKATSAGVKNFSLSFTPMYSDPTSALPTSSDATLNFSLTVGSTATSSSCSSAGLWP